MAVVGQVFAARRALENYVASYRTAEITENESLKNYLTTAVSTRWRVVVVGLVGIELKMARKLQAILFTVGLCLFAGAANAQYPEKAIRLVVPYVPGGLVDIMARTLQEPLSTALGQSVVIDNRPGAGGAVAARVVAQSAPDGYTLFFGNSSISAIVPFLQKDAGYDPITDFASVSLVATAPFVLVTHASVPTTDLKSFIEYVRNREATYASAGVGSLSQLGPALLARSVGAKLVHVPYKGAAPAAMAVLNGEVQMYMSSMNESLDGGIKAGKVRLLGVTTVDPTPLIPGVAPIATVVSGFDVTAWYAVQAARGTPAPIVARLNAAFREVLGRPDIQHRFAGYGCTASASSPEQLTEMIAQDVPKWRPIIEESGIKAE